VYVGRPGQGGLCWTKDYAYDPQEKNRTCKKDDCTPVQGSGASAVRYDPVYAAPSHSGLRLTTLVTDGGR
jgi:hypothetical protein